jgi:pyruvate/2-oxoglutarate dehydrogenase complex dihydrolipoamide acyltransferase (E2) component
MALVDVLPPAAIEGVHFACVYHWWVTDGELVQQGQDLGQVQTDRAFLTDLELHPVPAPATGTIRLLLHPFHELRPGTVMAQLDTASYLIAGNLKHDT